MTQTVSIDINSQLLINAQNYSKKMGSNLSRFIEVLLYQVVPVSTNQTIAAEGPIKPIGQLSPFVQSLCGVVKGYDQTNSDIDGDDVRLEHLNENL